jgi:hypothetical protein
MAIRYTRWSPDTCACIHDVQWDDSLPDTQRVHSAGATIALCSFHGALNVTSQFAALMDENPRKNKALTQILATATAVTIADITWSFDNSRVLNISCPKLTTNQKTTLQNWCNTNLGSGKVLFL